MQHTKEEPQYTLKDLQDSLRVFLEPGHSSTTRLRGICELTLREFADELLVACGSEHSPTNLDSIVYASQPGGSWTDATGAVASYVEQMGHACLGQFDRYIAMLPADSKEERAYRATVSRRLREFKRALESTNSDAGLHKAMSYAGLICDKVYFGSTEPRTVVRSELDNNTHWMGATNGVVNLQTGEFIADSNEARDKLVVGMLPDAYNPGATHWAVDKLLGHLDADAAAYLLSSLAYALRGYPSRLFLVLLGGAGGGKTTLLNALMQSLGVYAGAVNEDAFTRKRGNSQGLSPSMRALIAPRRLAILEEANRVIADTERLKAISGDGTVRWRDLYKSEREDRVTATVLMAANELPPLDATDSALRERMRVLPYPSIPRGKRDHSMRNIFANDATARQALVASIINAGIKLGDEPPQVPRVVKDYTNEAIAELIGDAGVWVIDRLAQVEGAKLHTETIWDAVVAEFGEPNNYGVTGGTTRRKLVRLVSGHYGKTTKVRSGGKARSGWNGLELR